MYNVLIVEDEIIQSHMIANSISEKFSNIRIYAMVSTGKEALNIIDKKVVDIIFLDLLLPDMSGIEILNYISNKDEYDYSQSVIICTGEMELLAKAVNNQNVFDYISKTDGLNRIVESLQKLLECKGAKEEKMLIKEQINMELAKLKYNFSYTGTKYLADCIYEVFISKEIYNFNLKKEIYPIIAKKYKQSVNNVKTNITRATSNMYYDCKAEILKKYLGYNVIEKPKIKEIIEKVIENL